MVGIKLDRCSLGRHDGGAVLFLASHWILTRAMVVVCCAACGIDLQTARLTDELFQQMEERSCLDYMRNSTSVVSSRRFDYETLHL